MPRFTTVTAALVAVALLQAGPGARDARGDAKEKDELARGDWDGKDLSASKLAGAASGKPTPDASGGNGATSDPTGGAGPDAPAGGGGTDTVKPNAPPTPGDDDDGDDDEPSPTTGDPAGPPTPGGGDDDAPPPQQEENTGSGTPTPGTAPPGGGGNGPTPDPALPSCGAYWEISPKYSDPELVAETTMWTLLIFRTDAFAFICNAYARSESTLFLDWFTQQTAASSMELDEEVSKRRATENYKDFEVEIRLVGGCGSCAPKVYVDGLCSAEAKAQVKPVESFLPMDPHSLAKAYCNSGWNAPINCGVKSSAGAAGTTGTRNLTTDLKVVKVSTQSGGGRVYAVDFNTQGGQTIVPYSYVKVKIRNFGDVFAHSDGDNSNVQAKARVGYDLSLRGTTACGATGDYIETLVAR